MGDLVVMLQFQFQFRFSTCQGWLTSSSGKGHNFPGVFRARYTILQVVVILVMH